MTTPKIEEIEPLALEFAKSLIANNEVSNDKLSEKSIELALQWHEERELRKRLLDKMRPNWIDLNKMFPISFLDENFNISDNYCMIQETGLGLNMVFGKMIQATYSADDSGNAKPKYLSASHGEVRYILTKEESAKFDTNFRPTLPEGIELAPRFITS